MRIAGPAIVGGITNDTGSNRIEFDVSAAGQQVPVGIDDARSKSPFPKRSGALMPVVEPSNKASSERLHRAAKGLVCRRRDQQMDVIRHQHIGMHRKLVLARDFRKPVQIATMISIVDEDRLPVVSSLYDVVRLSRRHVPRKPRHQRPDEKRGLTPFFQISPMVKSRRCSLIA